jgi:hypothetical protein
MELLGIFAAKAAIAIHQSQQFDRIGVALVAGLKNLAGETSYELQSALDETARDLSGRAAGETSGEDLDLRRLAELIYEFSLLGEAGRRLCLQVLGAFRDYRASRPGGY